MAAALHRSDMDTLVHRWPRLIPIPLPTSRLTMAPRIQARSRQTERSKLQSQTAKSQSVYLHPIFRPAAPAEKLPKPEARWPTSAHGRLAAAVPPTSRVPARLTALQTLRLTLWLVISS